MQDSMNKHWDIHGGIHPPENKTQSLGNNIACAPIPPQLVLPVSQHIGAPAKPIVKVGDQVLKGQCIAAAAGAVSVPIHASSSGTISAIEERAIAHPSGLKGLCIVIDTDGKEQWRDKQPRKNWHTLSNDALIDIIHDAGIAGMGGAGFPTPIKLNLPEQTSIQTLIINGTECEPYITADHALMRERADLLAEGIAILSKLIKPEKILIGIEDNKLELVDKLNLALAKHDYQVFSGKNTAVKIIAFPTKYPSGGEKQLIQILTGKQLPSGKLPSDIGVVCQNMGTVVAIRNAIVDDIPLISRITTLTGEAITTPQNYEVLLGTPIAFLLQHAQYQPEMGNRLIMGGPMMGFAITDTHAPVVKTTNCILAPSNEELPAPPLAQPCIRCGMCAEACPASLLPQQLYWFAQGKELDKLEAHNIADCIECGACSYVCPSHIPLVQYYRASKADIRQRNIDLQSAEHAKLRFEAREERLLRLEQDKIVARKARQAKAAANKQKHAHADPKVAVVAAALERVKAKKVEQKETQQTNKTHTVAAPAQAEKVVDLNDPIAKALAKRASLQKPDNSNPEEKLIKALELAQNRLNKATAKLQDAEAKNSEHIAAFKQAVEKTTLKLSEATTALNTFRDEH